MPNEPLWYDWHNPKPFSRVIPRSGNPLWFNPNTAHDPADTFNGGRFHPFDSSAGTRVPTLYAASSLKAAIAESPLLHDLPLTLTGHPHVLSMSKGNYSPL